MPLIYYKLLDLACVIGIVFGIRLMNSPETARKGNLIGAVSILIAISITMIGNQIVHLKALWISMILGAVIGSLLAVYVKMTQMPQLVALLNGLGGASSAIVALVVLTGAAVDISGIAKLPAVLALVIGGATFSGSIVAVAKLDGRVTPLPVILRGHFILNLLTLIAIGLLIPITILAPSGTAAIFSVLSMFVSLIFGVLFVIRIGGADMPIAISLLNSLSGIAAATVGLATSNLLVVAVGAIVGSAGIVLTKIMCRAMNSSILDVLTGKTTLSTPQTTPGPVGPDILPQSAPTAETIAVAVDKAIDIVRAAEKIIIVPGYGMALAQSQAQLKRLLDVLEQNGKKVKFAIHPVAGRMPGHMNVLLAEVEVPYDRLCPMEDINPEFKETNVALVVGANDVVNPAAKTAEGTPIYGMPVLNVSQADYVIICNKDTSPGYAGVENPLYLPNKNIILLLGDAAETLDKLLEKL